MNDNLKKALFFQLEYKKYLKIEATGNCMEPLLLDGDMLIIHKEKNYSKGDIVVSFVESMIKAHRVICTGQKILIKGDNAINAELVSFSDILGKVNSIERDGSLYRIKTSNESLNKIVYLSREVHEIYLRYLSFKRARNSIEYSLLKKELKNQFLY